MGLAGGVHAAHLTRDVKLRGTKMKGGDKVALWYNSANRDESTFDHPWLFDVARTPTRIWVSAAGRALLPGRQPGAP